MIANPSPPTPLPQGERGAKQRRPKCLYPSPLAGRRRGFAKPASRRRSRPAVQSRPWGAKRGSGERGEVNSRDFARGLRKTMTDVEHAIWKELRAHRFGDLKFKRQQPLGDYVVDFVCLGKRVVIELDGGQHAENIAYDTARDNWLVGQGFRVLRFWNNDVLNNREGVLVVIAEACGLDAGFSPSSLVPLPQGERGE